MKTKVTFPSTYLRHLAKCHRLSRKIYGHVIISYIQDFNLDFVSLGEDWKSFLRKKKEQWTVRSSVVTEDHPQPPSGVTFPSALESCTGRDVPTPHYPY